MSTAPTVNAPPNTGSRSGSRRGSYLEQLLTEHPTTPPEPTAARPAAPTPLAAAEPPQPTPVAAEEPPEPQQITPTPPVDGANHRRSNHRRSYGWRGCCRRGAFGRRGGRGPHPGPHPHGHRRRDRGGGDGDRDRNRGLPCRLHPHRTVPPLVCTHGLDRVRDGDPGPGWAPGRRCLGAGGGAGRRAGRAGSPGAAGRHRRPPAQWAG